jgi:toxin ParE1/3/4
VKIVAWEPAALEELDDALAVSRNAVEFQRVVNGALDDIASGRITHTQVPQTSARRCVLKKPPYSIIYTETDDEIRVWAFAHHKRRPGYWKKRLPKT